jgi:phosphopantothenoylcysteine decarboxylase / phosphopantothenate---cysteine ligase
MLSGKNVIIGISGGIAAYKAASLIRLFKKAGASVKVTGTRNAFEFITKVTLESLSENKVYDEVFGPMNDYTTEHVALTDWGDVFVVAPATANIIGKLAGGIADDALSTSLLAFNKKVFLAPAMNVKMWQHFSVQKNLSFLSDAGIGIIEPTEGFLACGYEGKGRMEEPEAIFDTVSAWLLRSNDLEGKRVLVSAGPTHEAIDPVRFMGNHSSGKMGYALAHELARRGARVELVSGPVDLPIHHKEIKLTKVVSARDMLEACLTLFPEMDAAIMAAAIADFSPETASRHKIKKEDQTTQLVITLKRTTDVLAELGKIKKKNQVLAGFALETENETDNAIRKLKNKNLNFIVLNSLQDPGAGFAGDTNKITIIDNKKELLRFNLKSKQAVAADIADVLLAQLNQK